MQLTARGKQSNRLNLAFLFSNLEILKNLKNNHLFNEDNQRYGPD